VAGCDGVETENDESGILGASASKARPRWASRAASESGCISGESVRAHVRNQGTVVRSRKRTGARGVASRISPSQIPPPQQRRPNWVGHAEARLLNCPRRSVGVARHAPCSSRGIPPRRFAGRTGGWRPGRARHDASGGVVARGPNWRPVSAPNRSALRRRRWRQAVAGVFSPPPGPGAVAARRGFRPEPAAPSRPVKLAQGCRGWPAADSPAAWVVWLESGWQSSRYDPAPTASRNVRCAQASTRPTRSWLGFANLQPQQSVRARAEGATHAARAARAARLEAVGVLRRGSCRRTGRTPANSSLAAAPARRVCCGSEPWSGLWPCP